MNLPLLKETPKNYVKLRLPLALPKTLTYAVPPGMVVEEGDYVRVECGRKQVWGVVWERVDLVSQDVKRIKPVLEVSHVPEMPDSLRQFLDKVATYTLSIPGAVLKMAMPVVDALERSEETVYQVCSILKESLSGDGASHEQYASACVGEDRSPNRSKQLNPKPKLTPQRQKVLDFLTQQASSSAAEIRKSCEISQAVLTGMEKAGLLKRTTCEVFPRHSPALTEKTWPNLARLATAQKEAAETINQTKGYQTFLLDGVTGSGKTEVYFEAIANAMQRGKQVLVLLPEISLSVQWLARFEQRFGFAPHVWHSALTPAKRRDTWREIAYGTARLVVGARSALFLPYADLGLIIVDEEHDGSYKQEDGVYYHARDMAVLRAHTEQIPIILTSATPSLESIANAREGRYQMLHLPERYGGAVYPEVTLVDMRQQALDAQHFISEPLKAALLETLAAEKQSLLFLNRRGYAPLTLCRKCGYRFQCPDCDAWLVLHQHGQHSRLQCHHCGYAVRYNSISSDETWSGDHASRERCASNRAGEDRSPNRSKQKTSGDGVCREQAGANKSSSSCPECTAEDSLVHCGPGVERVRDEISALFPQARLGLMTTDHLSTPQQVQQLLQQVEAHEIDILIGTQMLVKGHHFPKLALVGVVDGDMGMDGTDLRAAERCYAMLHQVAGRAGREKHPGRAFIQTYQPEHPVMQALQQGERDALIAAELTMREATGLPPYGRLAALILESREDATVLQAAKKLHAVALAVPGVQILGPAPAPLFRLRGQTRYRFLIKAPRNFPVQKLLSDWLACISLPRNISLRVDIDPYSFL